MTINLKPIFFFNIEPTGAGDLYILPDICIGMFGIYFTYLVGHDGRMIDISIFGKSFYFKFKRRLKRYFKFKRKPKRYFR